MDMASLGEVTATLEHTSLGEITARVRDLSLHGLAIELPIDAGSTLFPGDRLETLEVRADERSLFRGSGTVRRLGESDEGIVVGIELEGDGLDLAELHRRGARRSFDQRLQALGQARARNASVGSAFKAWAADLLSGLEVLRDFLGREEEALLAEDDFTRREVEAQILDAIHPWIVKEMVAARTTLNELVGGFSDEEHQLHRAYLKRHVAPLFAESPFMRRALEKPLGYAGDYEMMNMLYRDHREGSTLFGKALNLYSTNEEAAIANINRIEFLGAMIRERIERADRDRIRIASIGCGPAREIAALLNKSPELGARLDVALVDQEDRSIAYCEKTLAPLARATNARVQVIRESVRRLLTAQALGEALGERELIYSAGLFDYLNERTSRALISILYGALADGGRLAVGNVAHHNPSRWTMEYFSEWFLIHRTPEELLRLAEGLSPAPRQVRVDAEPSGVNLFLFVER
ncbi:SAM-dependent methyltransferase [Vulgatibacter incomptus]|uniref:SAM-dependent methyltransferase n=1 Tax=Vulgatibacter incomptus TaxID=1391653 RepID=A0A0K1PJL2_9BACT|nr:SAM-dependent methyltransferase [Vulgatibacter incomptus]